jgi:hypothetical protein
MVLVTAIDGAYSKHAHREEIELAAASANVQLNSFRGSISVDRDDGDFQR